MTRWVLPIAGLACLATGTLGRTGQVPVGAAQPAQGRTVHPSPIHVGENVHVSAANALRPHYEFIPCASPRNPQEMLAGVMTFEKGDDRVVVYRSSDGGAHWTEALAVGDRTGDPTCAYGPDGIAYFAALDRNQSSNFVLYRSTNGGASWEAPSHHQSVDRPYLIADDTGGPFHGSVYYMAITSARSIGTAIPGGPGFMTGPALFRSRDRGATFLGTMRVALQPQYTLGIGNPVLLADGSLIALIGVEREHSTPFNVDGRPVNFLKSVRSTPGGTDLREAVTVADWYLDRQRNDGTTIASLALDRTTGPYRGRLYAAWTDNRSGRSQVLVASSATNGDSWSAPVVVDDDLQPSDPQPQPDATNVSIAVNAAGVVGVAWGDRRDHADNLGWWYRFGASFDGGDTFTPSVKVASAANAYNGEQAYPLLVVKPIRSAGAGQPLPLLVAVWRHFYSSGDTVGMITDPAGRFHPMWCDNRTGISQLWTAAVTVDGSALRNGSDELADLDEVTTSVEVLVDAIAYDPRTNRGRLVIRLQNTSSETIPGPVKARILDASGEMGMPVLFADDTPPEQRGNALIRTFGSDALPAGGSTSAQTISFSLTSPRPPQPGHDFVLRRLELLRSRVRVFGGRQAK